MHLNLQDKKNDDVQEHFSWKRKLSKLSSNILNAARQNHKAAPNGKLKPRLVKPSHVMIKVWN